MIDILFIGPLGWETSVWKKLTNKLNNMTLEYIYYCNSTLDTLNTLEDFINQIDEILERINDETVLIASSFGTMILLKYLTLKPLNNKIIFVDGFQQFPLKEDLVTHFSMRIENFSNQNTYLNSMLDNTERQDNELVKIVLDNIDSNNTVTTSNANYLKSLTLFAGENPIHLLNKIETKNCFAFSSLPLDNISIQLISANDHLLMLTNPDKLNNILFHS